MVESAVWIAIVTGVPATLAALGNLVVILRTKKIADNVDRIEKQTNSMNSQMVASAKLEGRQEGKDRAEAAAAVTAASVAAVTATPALPIVIAPASNQDEIVKWIQKGIELEKARQAANGPKS